MGVAEEEGQGNSGLRGHLQARSLRCRRRVQEVLAGVRNLQRADIEGREVQPSQGPCSSRRAVECATRAVRAHMRTCQHRVATSALEKTRKASYSQRENQFFEPKRGEI